MIRQVTFGFLISIYDELLFFLVLILFIFLVYGAVR